MFSASNSACDMVASPMNPPTTPAGRNTARSAVLTRVTREVTRDRTRAQRMPNTAPSDPNRAGSSILADHENLNDHAEEEQAASAGNRSGTSLLSVLQFPAHQFSGRPIPTPWRRTRGALGACFTWESGLD
jgi:hypothetical protein